MKLTKSKLQQIIKEELGKVMSNATSGTNGQTQSRDELIEEAEWAFEGAYEGETKQVVSEKIASAVDEAVASIGDGDYTKVLNDLKEKSPGSLPTWAWDQYWSLMEKITGERHNVDYDGKKWKD